MTKNDAENIVYELAKGKKMGSKPYSFGHIKNAALLAENLAKACGLAADKAYVLGLLHDVGRFFVIDENNELIIKDLTKWNTLDLCFRFFSFCAILYWVVY